MQWILTGTGLLLALAIIMIGVSYIANPMTTTRSFGLPLPVDSPTIPSWLRLKGVRDVVAGLLVLAFMVWGNEWAVGLVLLVEALTPTGDMLVILAGKGSVRHALGIHGLTAIVMLLVAFPMMMGAN
ncbi:DUF4267 domain-containing protein [Pseudomonas sp. R2.Fl]|nr:DUF4267 domain-containing protein [Pseudomonas sp. R2.Fl]